jgi:hypothetical protein
MVYPIRGMYLSAIDRASHHIYLTHAVIQSEPDRRLFNGTREGVEYFHAGCASSILVTRSTLCEQ